MWISCHIYYERPVESFLINAINPIIDELIRNEIITNFFFIRYYDRGYHIRLRLKHGVEEKDFEIKNYLTNYLTDYINTFPSKRDSVEINHLPNNHFFFTEYEPEIERYGGAEAIIIAENQFQFSSSVIFKIIKETSEWTYQEAIIKAIYLNLAFCYSIIAETKETISFLKYNFDNWLINVYNSNSTHNRKEVITNYESQYEIRKNNLNPTIKALWLALNENAIFEEEWMNTWVSEMQKTSYQLNLVIKNRKPLYSIFDSYLHMTNNRLGILNRDESYISYLIYRSLEDIHGF